MRKFTTWCTLGAVMVMLLAGCSKKQTATVATESVATESATGITDENVTVGAAADKVELAAYKGIEIVLEPIEITDDQVDQQIQSVLTQYQITEEITDGEAAEGDTVTIDFKGLKDGVAFEGGTSTDYELTLGSGQFIDGFEDGIIGAKVGDELALDLTFPQEYQSEELAGAAVVFEVKVKAIKRITIPELDDTFVAEHAKEAKTVAEYQAEIKQELYDNSYSYQKQSAAFTAVIDQSKFEITNQSIEDTYNTQFDQVTQEASMYGMTVEQLVQAYQMDLESFEAMIRQEAVNGVKQQLVIDAIVSAEKFTVTEEERVQLAETYGYEDVEQMKSMAGQEAMDNYILGEQVFTFLADHAVEK